MVGGVIVEAVRLPDGAIWVNCAEHPRRQECAIILEPTNERIRCGDSLWWQGRYAMWTPKSDPLDSRSDVHLRRRGYSGVGRPEWAYR
jgi:hypothetical protein